MDSFTLYMHKQRQFERKKLQHKTAVVVQDKTTTINPEVKAQAIIKPAGDIKTTGLLGKFETLQDLITDVEQTETIRGRSKKNRLDENKKAFRKYQEIIESWINAKVILDRRAFALFIYVTEGVGDYPLLIRMCDLSVELGVINFKPFLKREVQAFIIDEFYKIYQKNYLFQPDGKNTLKKLREKFPDYFWVIFDRVINKKVWLTHWSKAAWLLNLAGLDCQFKGDFKNAIAYWEQGKRLREENFATQGGSGIEKELAAAYAKLAEKESSL